MNLLEADTVPFRGERPGITDYVVTGLYRGLSIPESYCKKCNLFLKAAEDAKEELDSDIDVSVRSSWTRFLYPLLKGGYRPTLMLIAGGDVAQGFEVPEKELIVENLEAKYG